MHCEFLQQGVRALTDRNELVESLKEVYDPEIGVNIVVQHEDIFRYMHRI